MALKRFPFAAAFCLGLCSNAHVWAGWTVFQDSATVATMSAFANGPFATYNLLAGPYNALLDVFNAVTPATNKAVTFTNGSPVVGNITAIDMAVGGGAFCRDSSSRSI